MKKVLAILLALVLVLAFSVPALAVTTGVTVEEGGGNIPVIKCKWEETDMDLTVPGVQIIPSCQFEVSTPVYYFVVVTDVEDNGNVGQVWVDVYHPDDWPDPDTGECGTFKYEVPLDRWVKSTDAIKEQVKQRFTDADNAGLVTYAAGYDYDDVLDELDKCTADVWYDFEYLEYHQPAGNYMVEAVAIDQSGNESIALNNTFEYVAASVIEIDFTGVDYGSTSICKEKWVPGDTEFGTADYPTVRNIGNTDVMLNISQDDMDFGFAGTTPTAWVRNVPPPEGWTEWSNWNVVFDARLGSNPEMGMYYEPDTTVTLPNKLYLCNTEELDFSIHIKKATAGETHSGSMMITCERAAWNDCAV